MPRKRIDVMGGFLLLVVLFAPREIIAQRRDPNEVGKGCFPIGLQERDAPRTSPRRSSEMPSFSARAILDLEFQIRLHRSARADQVEVKFFTPEGNLYQVLSVPVSAEGRAHGKGPQDRR